MEVCFDGHVMFFFRVLSGSLACSLSKSEAFDGWIEI